ncbi:MAG: sulfite exporter TauE/SafE family protein [Candidatus Omnitrophica bacterium]|nr:sulfite exporter TauE/SafE family protein [Candidatus Omnitrophota bacterium]
MHIYFVYILIGLFTGFISGCVGIGGGAVMVPIFVLLFGLSQHQAQGTSLAVMALPIFWLAAWRYYSEGNVDVSMAIFVAIGLVFGALLGANTVQGVQPVVLRRIFAVVLILVAIKMLLIK